MEMENYITVTRSDLKSFFCIEIMCSGDTEL